MVAHTASNIVCNLTTKEFGFLPGRGGRWLAPPPKAPPAACCARKHTQALHHMMLGVGLASPPRRWLSPPCRLTSPARRRLSGSTFPRCWPRNGDRDAGRLQPRVATLDVVSEKLLRMPRATCWESHLANQLLPVSMFCSCVRKIARTSSYSLRPVTTAAVDRHRFSGTGCPAGPPEIVAGLSYRVTLWRALPGGRAAGQRFSGCRGRLGHHKRFMAVLAALEAAPCV
jgi:hypothetical protein